MNQLLQEIPIYSIGELLCLTFFGFDFEQPKPHDFSRQVKVNLPELSFWETVTSYFGDSINQCNYSFDDKNCMFCSKTIADECLFCSDKCSEAFDQECAEYISNYWSFLDKITNPDSNHYLPETNSDV